MYASGGKPSEVSTHPVVLEGVGLHGAKPGRVTLRRRPGPVTLAVGGVEARVADLAVVGTVRAVTVEAPDAGFRVRTVDHLFSALAGSGIYEGVAIEVEGEELPLLDGCARRFLEALRSLGPLPASPPALRIVKAGVIEARASRFELTPPEGDDARPRLEVSVDFGGYPGLALETRWDGDALDYDRRIADARTFAFESEVQALLASGLAQHVTPESVVILAQGGPLFAGPPFSPDEPVRHKLLDLLGDLYLFGGPPAGCLRAFRPGHGATYEAVREAFARGLLEVTGPRPAALEKRRR